MVGGARMSTVRPQTEGAGLAGEAAPFSPDQPEFQTTSESPYTRPPTVADSQSSLGSSLSSGPPSVIKAESTIEEPFEDDDGVLDNIVVAQPQPRAKAAPIKKESSSSPSPAKGWSRPTAGNFLKDSDSELSDLGGSPPPPSQLMRERRHLDRKLECTCTGLCTCAMHAAYPDDSPAHLSEHTLSGTETPISALRSTLLPSSVSGFVYPNDEVARTCKAAAILLTTLDNPPTEARHVNRGAHRDKVNKAHHFTQNIITCYPPSEDLPRTTSAIQRVLDALRIWQKEKSFENLWSNFDDAVNGNPDLILEFQTFLPSGRTRAGMSELWQRRVEKLGWGLGKMQADTPIERVDDN